MSVNQFRAFGLLALLLVALALPLLVTLPYFLHLIILALIWRELALIAHADDQTVADAS